MLYSKEPPTLFGEIITMRNIIPEQDSKPFYEIFLEPDMHLWTGNNIPINQNESYKLLEKYRSLDGLIAWTIIKNDSQEFIGTYWIAPAIMEGKRIISAEAQRIGKQFWRKGYTIEARKLVYDFSFNTLEVKEIHAQAWEGNVNSCLSMENIGFTLYKKEEKIFPKRNRAFVENYYILYKDNWNVDII